MIKLIGLRLFREITVSLSIRKTTVFPMSSLGVLSGLLRFATPSLTHSTPLTAALSSAIASTHRSYSKAAAAAGAEAIQWVFLGAPGVGKGTYASRAAKHFNVAHIATGDLIREEIKAGSALGKQVRGSLSSARMPSWESVTADACILAWRADPWNRTTRRAGA